LRIFCFIAKLESSGIQSPIVDAIQKIAKALGVNVNDLIK